MWRFFSFYVNGTFKILSWNRIQLQAVISKRKKNVYALGGFFGQFLAVEIIAFLKVIFYPIKDIGSLKVNLKRCFTSDLVFAKLWEFDNCQYGYAQLGLSYARFEVFIPNAESVARIIYAWRTITLNKIVPNCTDAS